MYAHIERSQIKGKLDGFRVVPEWLVENDMDPMLRVNPEIPPDACPLHYGSDPVLLRRPTSPTGCVLSPPRRIQSTAGVMRQRSS